jgi:hypothetical protein
MSTTRLEDMMAGPGGTGALISPDGTRIFHVGSSNTCVLDLSDAGTWERTFCEKQSFDNRPKGLEDMLWSPEGGRLLMPTYDEAFFSFKDTDIEVFDPDTFEITNLTDDKFEGGLLRPSMVTSNLDVMPRWIDEGTIAFLRYVIPDGDMTKRTGAQLMTVDAAGGEPRQMGKQLAPDNILIYTLAVSPGGQQAAYVIPNIQETKGAGVYVVDLAEGTPRRIANASEIVESPTGLVFSADGEYLLIIEPVDDIVDARVLDLETGAVVRLGEGENVIGVAWAPTGAALAYIVWNGPDAETPGGLVIADAPGMEPTLLVVGQLMAPRCCSRQPFTWASNNTILLGRVEDHQTVLEVKLSR